MVTGPSTASIVTVWEALVTFQSVMPTMRINASCGFVPSPANALLAASARPMNTVKTLASRDLIDVSRSTPPSKRRTTRKAQARQSDASRGEQPQVAALVADPPRAFPKATNFQPPVSPGRDRRPTAGRGAESRRQEGWGPDELGSVGRGGTPRVDGLDPRSRLRERGLEVVLPVPEVVLVGLAHAAHRVDEDPGSLGVPRVDEELAGGPGAG